MQHRQSLRSSSHEELDISPVPKINFEGIRSHNPTNLLCLSPKKLCTREITSLTGSSSLEELNRTEGIPFFGTKNATPIDALVLKNYVLVKLLP